MTTYIKLRIRINTMCKSGDLLLAAISIAIVEEDAMPN